MEREGRVMSPAFYGRIVGAVLAAVLVLGAVSSALAGPTKITEIKGKKLFLYETDEGKRVDSLNPDDVPLPLKILRESTKGKFLVDFPGRGKLWVLKAQAVTDAGDPEVPVDCQNITESYASTRALGDC
jgi:hypothetical protein